MIHVEKALRSIIADENGGALAEYALVLGLFSGLGFIGFLSVIKVLSTSFTKIASALGNAHAVLPTTTVYFP